MLKNTQLVAVFTIISQLVSFLRMSIIASRFGVDSNVDVYNLAIVFPTLLTAILVGWLQVSFVGSYIKIQKTENEKSNQYLCSILILVVVMSLVLSGIAFSCREQISTWLMPTNRNHDLNQLTEAFKITVWLIVPMVVCEYLGLILNCNNRFLLSSLAPILNAIISALALYLMSESNLNSLVSTLVGGWIIQIVFMFVVTQSFFRSNQFEILYAYQQMARSLNLAIPLIPAVVFSNATSVVIQGYLSRMGEGTVAVFAYASKFQTAIVQVFVMGLSTVLLPHLANLFAEKQHREVGFLFVKICKVTTFLYLTLILGVYLYGEGLLTILLGRGRFDQTTTKEVWLVWLLISTSILPFSISMLMAKAFQALQKPWLLSLSSSISLIVTTTVCYFSWKMQSLTFLLLSFSIAQTIVLIYFGFIFQRTISSIRLTKIFMQTALFSSLLLLVPLVGHFILQRFFKTSSIVWYLDLVIFCGLLIFTVRHSNFIGWVNDK